MVVSLTVILPFLLFSPQPKPVGDALGYALSAYSFSPGNELEMDGSHYYRPLVRAPWLVLNLIALFTVFSADMAVVVFRFFQAGLLLINFYLVYRLVGFIECKDEKAEGSTRVLRWRYAAVTFLCVGYLPFLFLAGHIFNEILTTTFLLVAVLYWVKRQPYLSGLFTFFALSNSWFSLLPKFAAGLLMLLGYMCFKKWQCLYRGGAKVQVKFLGKALGVFTVLTLILIAAYTFVPEFNQPLLGFWLFSGTQGWETLDSYLFQNLFQKTTQNQDNLKVLEAFPQLIQQDLRLALSWIWRHPWESVLLVSNNIYRLFAMPNNVYGIHWLGLSPMVQIVYHQMLIWVAFIMSPLTLGDSKTRFLWFFPIIWCVYAFSHIEARYNTPVMPFLIMLAALGGIRFYQLYVLLNPLKHRIVLAGFMLIVFGASGHFFYTTLPVISDVIPIVEFTLLQVACLIVGLYSIFRIQLTILLTTLRLPRHVGLIACGFVVLMVFPFCVNQFVYPEPVSWRTPLSFASSMQGKVVHQIPVRLSQSESNLFHTYLVIEIQTLKGQVKSLGDTGASLSVNGLSIRGPVRPTQGLQSNYFEYILGGMRSEKALNQYQFYRLPESIMQSIIRKQSAEIVIRLPVGDEHSVLLVGDFPYTRTGGYVIPSPDWGEFSAYKALHSFRLDGRLPRRTQLQGEDNRTRALKNMYPFPGRPRIFLYSILKVDLPNPNFDMPAYHDDVLTNSPRKYDLLWY